MHNLEQGYEGGGPPSKSVLHSTSPTDSGRGASLKDPVYVDDFTSAESAEHTDDGPLCPKRSRIVTRVHTNPGLYAKFVHGRLPVSRTPARKGYVVTVRPLSGGQSCEQRFRNPPGYDLETDFGCTPAPNTNSQHCNRSKIW